jgi:SAM-dependent methyltransferase
LDLMTDPLPSGVFDASWCRWVAAFVSSPELLVEKLAAAIRPGGVAIFHEYGDYATWRFAPRRPRLEDFVQRVMTTWRASGGEPDVAPALLPLLKRHGFTVRAAVPRIFCLRPTDPMWRWPAAFVNVGLDRLVALGAADSEWAAAARLEFAAAEADPDARMLTPMVLEIVAERLTAPTA